MPISIITRAYKTSELEMLIKHIDLKNEPGREIIAVCNINDYNFNKIENFNIIIENSNMFEARITGIKNAKYDDILLLDSDQIPGDGLLNELDNAENDILIIPERSLNHNFVGKCLDDWRVRNEKYAMKDPNPYIPVVPRYYKKTILIDIIHKLPLEIYNVIAHEDSILYYMAFKQTQNIRFTKNYIYNSDPSVSTLMRKAFKYGKNKKDIKQVDLPYDLNKLINQIDKNSLNIKELGLGKGYIIQSLKGIAYVCGSLL